MATEALPLVSNKVAVRKLIVFGCFLVTAVTLIPVVMMVLVAFQSDAESMAAKPSFWPSSWHPENLTRAFAPVTQAPYAAMFNTLRATESAGELEVVERVTSRDERALGEYRAGKTCHPLLPYADWAGCRPSTSATTMSGAR